MNSEFQILNSQESVRRANRLSYYLVCHSERSEEPAFL